MAFDEEFIKGMSAIYKYVFENKEVHRNVLRKQMLNKGKIASKEKFNKIVEGLSALGKIKIDREQVTLNPNVVSLGVLQKGGNDFYVVTPNSNKHYSVSKSVASGYSVGDVLDVALEYSGKEFYAVVLGKSNQKIKAPEKPKTISQGADKAKGKNLILGRVVKLSHDELVFIPNKKSISLRHIPILNSKDEMSAFQDKICVMDLENLDAPLQGGKIVAVKGDAGNPIHEYDAIAECYGAIMGWDDPGLALEIENIPTAVNTKNLDLISEEEAKYSQIGKVVDLRNLPFATIDPATCKDMDDAICSSFDENGDIVCYTAVANVTKYVNLDSKIGKNYIAGCFTIYAPNKAYNILPTKLSTGICSLNPGEDRQAFVVKTVIDKDTGKAKESKIYDAIIRSRHKYSYEDAQKIVDDFGDDFVKETLQFKALHGIALTDEEQLVMNKYAAQIIWKGFDQRKMIRFVSNDEREIVFDQDLDDVVDIKVISHLFYHDVIEAFMVTANEATAKYAKENGLNNIYRVHAEPNSKKLDRATEFFDVLGIEFDGNLSAEGTRSLIEITKDTSMEEVINKFLIKMQSRAVYSENLYPDNGGNYIQEDLYGERISHYALQSPHYSHTTSPIRRVPDYLTQYNILANIHCTKPISLGQIKEIVEQANKRQLDVDQAEKDFEDISSVIYCEKHIGEKMHGRITKIRYTSADEEYDDEIVAIVKNDEKGISVEIPLSQILGHPATGCSLSQEGCAVYDERGKVVLAICKPLDFIIEKADRRTMTVSGKTNRELLKSAALKSFDHRNHKNSSRPNKDLRFNRTLKESTFCVCEKDNEPGKK